MLNRTLNIYRSAYSGLSRSTWLLSFVMLVNRSGTMVVPFITLYLTSPAMGFSLAQAGFVFGLFGAGATIGAYFGGRLTDKIGFYPVQLITLTGGGLLFLVLGQMHHYGLICLFTFLLSFVNEAFRPANSTAIAFYSKEDNRTRSYSLNRLAINLGWAVGSGIGGLVAKYNYEWLFWIDGLTNISAAILMWVFIKPANGMLKRKAEKKQAQVEHSAYKDFIYLCFIFLTLLFAACFFQLFTNFSFYCRNELHFSEPFIGFLMALNGVVIALIEMVLVYKLEKNNRTLFYITSGVMLVAMGYLMLNIVNVGRVFAVLIILVMTLGEILAMPFMNTFWTSRSRPENRGQYAALYSMGWSVAQTLGPMTGAHIGQKAGFANLWWMTGGLCIFTAIGFRFLNRLSQGRKINS